MSPRCSQVMAILAPISSDSKSTSPLHARAAHALSSHLNTRYLTAQRSQTFRIDKIHNFIVERCREEQLLTLFILLHYLNSNFHCLYCVLTRQIWTDRNVRFVYAKHSDLFAFNYGIVKDPFEHCSWRSHKNMFTQITI